MDVRQIMAQIVERWGARGGVQNDGIWQTIDAEGKPISAERDRSAAQLRMLHARGGLSEPVHALLAADQLSMALSINALLDQNFPESLHTLVAEAVGVQLPIAVLSHRPRNPMFRESLLQAYQAQCAVCGYDLQIDRSYVGLEAAHIHWHRAGGPDRVENGLLLCSLHHTLFDFGAFTLRTDHCIEVSNRVIDRNNALLDYRGKRIREPVNGYPHPASDFLRWHHREVFKGPPPAEKTA